MIILEGADGTGKTTAAQEISRYLRVPLVHSDGPDLVKFSSVFNFHAARPDQIVVYDRFYLSEFIYGPIIRGTIMVPQWFKDYSERVWFPAIKPMVIWCDTEDEVAITSVADREEMAGVKENHAAILKGYRDYMLEHFLPEVKGPRIMLYNWRKHPLDLAGIADWVMWRRKNEYQTR